MGEFQPLVLGDVLFQPMYRCASIDGDTIRLTEVESKVLEALARAERMQGSREALCSAMYRETGFSPSSVRHVDKHICNLRRKLNKARNARIDAVRNVGYKLCVSVTNTAANS